MIIELNPSLVFAEVLVPAPALEVYIEILSNGTQKNIQLNDNEAASNVDATSASVFLIFTGSDGRHQTSGAGTTIKIVCTYHL